MWIPGILGLIGVIAIVIARTFSRDINYYVKAKTVKQTELRHYEEALS